jgi:hypothetical protein
MWHIDRYLMTPLESRMMTKLTKLILYMHSVSLCCVVETVGRFMICGRSITTVNSFPQIPMPACLPASQLQP